MKQNSNKHNKHIFTCQPNEIGEYTRTLSAEDFRYFAFAFLAMPMDDTITDNGKERGGFFYYMMHAPQDQVETFRQRCVDSGNMDLRVFMQSKFEDFVNFCHRRSLLFAFVKSMESPQLEEFSSKLDPDELTILKGLTQSI